MRTLRFYNYLEFEDLFNDYPPSVLTQQLTSLRDYLQNGHDWYRNNIEAVTDLDIADELKLVHDLIGLTVAMSEFSPPAPVYSYGDQFVNLIPLIKYMNQVDASTRVNGIVRLKDKMIQYLTADNVLNYKKCYDFIDAFSRTFYHMYHSN